MKAMIEQDASEYYFIQNNKTNCIDKTLSLDTAWWRYRKVYEACKLCLLLQFLEPIWEFC